MGAEMRGSQCSGGPGRLEISSAPSLAQRAELIRKLPNAVPEIHDLPQHLCVFLAVEWLYHVAAGVKLIAFLDILSGLRAGQDDNRDQF
jgi:hypothetical protein